MPVGSRSWHVTSCASTAYTYVVLTAELTNRRYDWNGFALKYP